MPLRVLLADDHRLVIDAFCHVLRLDPDITEATPVYTAEDGLREALRLNPDLVVFDITFPGRDAFDLLPELRRQRPETRIVILTGHLTDMFLWQALRIGVRGYILKDESPARVHDVLKLIAAGEQWYSPAVRERLIWNDRTQAYEMAARQPLMDLTVEQLAIVRHFARGESLKEVAQALGRTEKAIDSMKYRVMHRLGVKDRVDLCHLAIREGLIVV